MYDIRLYFWGSNTNIELTVQYSLTYNIIQLLTYTFINLSIR